MKRRLTGIGARKMGATRAYIDLPPELEVIYDPDKLVLQHARGGRLVSLHVRIDLEDFDPETTPWEGKR